MFKILIAVCALVAPTLGAPSKMPSQYARIFAPMKIVGGQPATLGQFPHQVSFQINYGGWMHYCGGSIVTPTLIITASHCLESGVSESRVIAGVLDHMDTSTGQVRNVVRAQQHPDFDMWFNIVNDIAFLILDEPLEFNDNVQAIKVASASDVPSADPRACTASGWGNAVIGNPSSKYMNFVDMDYIDDADCEDMWSDVANVFGEQNVCAGTDAGGESVCQGDSGGPLICKTTTSDDYVLFGATSWGSGYECGEKGRPAVWAEVPYFADWIQTESGISFP